jgi:hypothetical protein
MSKRSDAVKKWRSSTKHRIVDSMGGKCQICGYDKCVQSLDLHHKNPQEKDFGFGAIRGNPKSWVRIVEELRKCVLICANCHREIHAGLTQIPLVVASFDEEYLDYQIKQNDHLFDNCPVCGAKKTTRQLYCSRSCAGIGGGKVDWNTIDLLELLKTKNKSQIADDLGISEAAVRKRYKKLCGVSSGGRTPP